MCTKALAARVGKSTVFRTPLVHSVKYEDFQRYAHNYVKVLQTRTERARN